MPWKTSATPSSNQRFGRSACSYFEISLALQDVSLRSDGPLSLLLLWVYDTQSKIALSKNVGMQFAFPLSLFYFPFLGNNADESYEAGDEAR